MSACAPGKSTFLRLAIKSLFGLLTMIPSLAGADIARQEMSSWCWAACIQDIEQQVGLLESQAHIVQRLYGAPFDQAASIPQVAALLQQARMRGQYFMRPPGNPAEIVGAFSSAWKMIILVDPSLGPTGHFVVLEAADFNGNVLVSDPFPPFTLWMSVAAVYQQYHWIGSILIARP
ncbi:MAG TPA: hypothetical protein VGD78_20810 [Chthoniobacterales bacterium]